MQTFSRILAATALTLPLAVFAQTTAPKGVTPADQPTSTIEKDATTKTGQATKYGTTGTGTDATATTDTKMHKGAKHDTMKQNGTAPAGDTPTYPAPAKDGTPTK